MKELLLSSRRLQTERVVCRFLLLGNSKCLWSILHMTVINLLKDYYQLSDKHIREEVYSAIEK